MTHLDSDGEWVTRQETVNIYRCSWKGCDYVMWDAAYGDVEDHYAGHFHDPDCLLIDPFHEGSHMVRPGHPKASKNHSSSEHESAAR